MSRTYSYVVGANTSGGSEVPVPAGYRVTFEDYFTGSSVDTTKWNVRNNTYLSYEQSYLKSANVTVADGKLAITPKLESAGGRSYTSGYIDTIGKFSQRYGLFQVRAKVNTPIGTSQGIWPAPLWLRGDTSVGEIDVVEAWGTSPGNARNYRLNSAVCSIHQNTNGGGGKVSNWLSANDGTDLSLDYHLYEILWTPTSIVSRIDGVTKVTATAANAPWAFSGTDYAGAFHLRVNVQVSDPTQASGTTWGGPDAYTEFGNPLLIDYIRVLEEA